MNDLISRQAAIEALKRAEALTKAFGYHNVIDTIRELPSAQPEIIRCRDCKYGELDDDDDRWYCRSLGCQIGNEDGSGFCADAERRE